MYQRRVVRTRFYEWNGGYILTKNVRKTENESKPSRGRKYENTEKEFLGIGEIKLKNQKNQEKQNPHA